MQELARLVVVLPAFDEELLVLHSHVDIASLEPRHSERDPQSLGPFWARRDALDVIGRVTVARSFGQPIESPLDLVETQHERRRQTILTRHHPSPFLAPITAA